jgi:hypothetical protein
MSSSRITHLSIPVLLATLLLAACGSSSDTQASPAEPPTTNPTTTAAVTTTVAETTTTAAETTTTEAVATTVAVTIAGPALTAADLVLSADGLGPLMFGDADDSTIYALASALGDPSSDGSLAYPAPLAGGWFDSADGDWFFAHPFGREVCFDEAQLCASFGGSSADDLAFVGWELGGRSLEALSVPFSTADGVTIGSTLADFEAVMSLSEVGCYTLGYGDTGGIDVRFEATTGALFDLPFPDPASTEVFERPSPDVIVVERLSAGDRQYFNGGDCPR